MVLKYSFENTMYINMILINTKKNIYRLNMQKFKLLYVFLLIASFLLCMFYISKYIKYSVEQFIEFIHIPKNAGTTIENIGNDVNIKWGRFKPKHREYTSMKNVRQKCSYWHIPPKDFDNNLIYNENETFCVLRNPYDRIVSEYKYRNKDEKHTPEKMNSWIKKHLIPKNYEKGGLNCHFIPQSDFIHDAQNNVTCDNILDFDNLTSEFNQLTELRDIDLKLDDEIKHNRTIQSVTISDLDHDVQDLIYNVYKRDFDELKKLKQSKNGK